MKRLMNIVNISAMVALLGCLLAPTSATAQGVLALADDTIALGDQTTVSLPSGLALSATDGIEVLRQAMDSVTGTMQAVVTSFEPGEHWLHADSDSVLLVVTDVEVDTASADIRDIAAIERVPYTFWEIFRWVLLALAIAAVAFVVWWLLKHRQKIERVLGVAPQVDTRNPEERALQSLEDLRQRQLWQSGRVKEYHTELTDAVRRFIEECTNIHATDMTSDETVAAVEDGQWKVDSNALRSIFTTADLVKFAKSEPLPAEHEASMNAAVDFVHCLWEQVKPKEEVKDE